MRRLAVVVFMMNIVSAQAVAASFDCAKAQTRVEKMICADAELSKADEEMAAAYARAMEASARLEPADQQDLKQWQRSWLVGRQYCDTRACLLKSYALRARVLDYYASHLEQPSGSRTTLTGEYFMQQTQYSSGILSVRQLSSRAIQFSLIVTQMIDPANNNVHFGQQDGTAQLDGQTATYRPKDDSECRITMKFQKTKALITHQGRCDFGEQTSPDGPYFKTSDTTDLKP